MADTVRAFGMGVQSVLGTAVTPVWNSFYREHTHKPNLTKDIPKYKTNTRHTARRALVKQRYDEVDVTFDVDSLQVAKTLTALCGAATGTSTETWLTGGATAVYMTLAWYDGITSEYFLMQDAQAAKGVITLNATGNGYWQVKVTFWGPAAIKQSSTPSVTYVEANDTSPFEAWTTVVTRGGAAGCLTDFELTIDNGLHPVWCTPSVAPGGGTPPGLAPTRYALGDVMVTTKFTVAYTGYTGSSFKDFIDNTAEAWVFTSTQPGFLSTWTITLPTVQGTSGEIDRNQPELYETVSGTALYNASLTAEASLAIIHAA